MYVRASIRHTAKELTSLSFPGLPVHDRKALEKSVVLATRTLKKSVFFATETPNYRVFLFANSARELQALIEPGEEGEGLRRSAETVWRALEDSLQGSHPELALLQIVEHPNGVPLATATQGFRAHALRRDNWVTYCAAAVAPLVVGVWLALGLEDVAGVVAGAIPAVAAALFLVIYEMKESAGGQLKWDMQ